MLLEIIPAQITVKPSKLNEKYGKSHEDSYVNPKNNTIPFVYDRQTGEEK